MAKLYRYAAFISYSSKDAAFAKRLHRALERYGIPSTLGKFDLLGGGGKPNRIYPVFRDREELPAGDLSETILAALEASGALIIVCSPDSAASPWVEKEIRSFFALGRRNRVFAIIAPTAPLVMDGRDATVASLPPALIGNDSDGRPYEPIAADTRKGKDGFRNACLKLVSGLVGVNAGVLQDRDRRRRRWRTALTTAAIGTLAAASIGAWLWSDTLTWRTRLSGFAEAAANRGDALEAATFALAGEPAPGALIPSRSDRADDVLFQATKVPLIQNFGVFPNFDLSRNGTLLVLENTNGDGFYYDLAHGGAPGRFRISGGTADLFIHRVANGGSGFLAIGGSGESSTYFDVSRGGKEADLGTVYDFALSDDGNVLVTRDQAGVSKLYEFARSRTTELGKLQGVALSADGAVLIAHGFDSETTAYDLRRGTMRPLGRLGSAGYFHISRDGAKLVAPDTKGALLLFDLAAGTPPRRISGTDFTRTGSFQLAASGTALLVQDDMGTVYYDLQHDTSRNLGETGFALSENGASLIGVAVSDFTATYYDLAHPGTQRGIGKVYQLHDFEMSYDGSVLVTSSSEHEPHELQYFDLARASVAHPLGLVADRGVGLPDNGSAVVTMSASDQTGRYYDLRQGGEPGNLGRLATFRLSADGKVLVVQTANRTILEYELGSTHRKEQDGKAMAAQVCRESGDAIPPFPANYRAPAARGPRSAADNALYDSLRGRPWHPCDWRGLGDGLEGLGQWWRMIRIRYLGAPDYACEERDASGRRDDVSRARCARLIASLGANPG